MNQVQMIKKKKIFKLNLLSKEKKHSRIWKNKILK
jgi:hypothetical protein